MTERLYYNDSTLMNFSAQVIERTTHDGRPAVILDRSAFYPSSGGQPNDTGMLAGVGVLDVAVREADGAVLHILAAPLPADLDSADGEIDRARRFDHMQHHTGQHILTQAFVQTANAHTVGFHLSPDSVTIDLDVPSLSDAQVDAAEDLANRIVTEDRPVTPRLRELDDQEGVRIRRLPRHLLTEGLRVIEIEGFDTTACGGTHVARTGEIGLIKVLRLERRGERTRVEFRCGERALRDYREKNRVANRLAADLDCRVAETPAAVARLRDEFRANLSALKAATSQLTDFEADRLLAGAPRRNGAAWIVAAFDGRDPAEVKLLAQRLTTGASTVALLAAAGEKTQFFFARTADLPFDMAALLKETLVALGGRGGGQPAFAQGGGIPTTVETARAALDAAAARLEG